MVRNTLKRQRHLTKLTFTDYEQNSHLKGALMSWLKVSWAMVAFGWTAGLAAAKEWNVSLERTNYRVGDEVNLVIAGIRGPVTIESDVAAASLKAEISDQIVVPVGRLGRPGVYFVLVRTSLGMKAVSLAVPFADRSSSFSDVRETTTPDAGLSTLYRKLIDGIDGPCVRDAGKKALAEFLQENPVSLSTTVVACSLSPYAPPLIQPCVTGAGKNTADLAVGFLVHAADYQHDHGLLADREWKLLTTQLSVGKLAFSVLLTDKAAIDQMLNAVSWAAESISADGAKLTIKYTADEADKIRLLLQLTK